MFERLDISIFDAFCSGLWPGNHARQSRPDLSDLTKNCTVGVARRPLKSNKTQAPSSCGARMSRRAETQHHAERMVGFPVCCPLILDFETASQLNTFITLKYRP
jgi:hypothetical protein